jgi:hypothetical protein
MLRPTRNVLDLLKDWQAAGEPYVKVVAPLAWPRSTTPAVAIAPLLHARARDDVPSDLGLYVASKPIYLTISTETLPVTVDALSSNGSSSGIISPTSLSFKTAAVRGGLVNSIVDDDDIDDDDATMMMISSNSGPSMDHQQLKAELHSLREELRRANNRYDVLL